MHPKKNNNISDQHISKLVSQAYIQGNTAVHSYDQFLFDKPLHERLKENNKALVLWLKNYKIAKEALLKSQKEEPRAQQKNTLYFK